MLAGPFFSSPALTRVTMPSAAPRPCTYPGCGQLVHGGSRCEQHRRLHTGAFGDGARGSRHERGYGTEWDKTRRRILGRDAGVCQHCLRESGLVHAGNEVDHIVNKAEWKRRHGTLDGVDDDDNLQTICRDAHRLKTQAEARRGKA
jgi:5-methylcytosine-specific restriction protein A